MIILYTERTAMLGNNSSGDGQAQPGAALLGRKMRKEKLVLVLRRNPVASIRHCDFNRIGFGVEMGGDGDFAAGRVLERFCSVVNQVDDHASQQRPVRTN